MILPVMLLGGLWANVYSAKELDEVSAIERTRRPLSDFWSGVLLGAILGLWTGVNYGPSLRQTWSTIDKVASWVLPGAAGPPAEKRPDAEAPQVVYYPAPQQ
mmetsp:Transcript_21564/g.64333  ORF Transcript_21564/g.64333 Transcript_21564/m.64333 type:complete len:102 (+) Transcript_21564:76-381(+)